jgi:hypothetical protein
MKLIGFLPIDVKPLTQGSSSLFPVFNAEGIIVASRCPIITDKTDIKIMHIMKFECWLFVDVLEYRYCSV